MSLSSLGFGLLILLTAVLAQSAPHIYSDDDEEALIDKLAALTAAAGDRDVYNKPIFSDFDLSSFGYMDDGVNQDLISKAALANMPRQFAYKPDDIRFFLPASQFANYLPVGGGDDDLEENELREGRQPDPGSLGVKETLKLPVTPDVTVQGQSGGFGRQDPGYLMKKSQPQPQLELHDTGYIPSHLRANDHSVDNMGVTVERNQSTFSDIYYIGIIAGCSAAAVVAIIAAGICWYRIHERVKAAADVDYPAYGVTGPSKDVSPSGGDRKLAQSAHMYHYQHQKQQMAALQKGTMQGTQGSAGSDVESEDDNEEGDYTVYECPGLAPAGEMEVKNPLFQDEPTPATPQIIKTDENGATEGKEK